MLGPFTGLADCLLPAPSALSDCSPVYKLVILGMAFYSAKDN